MTPHYDAIDVVILPRARDLSSFSVRHAAIHAATNGRAIRFLRSNPAGQFLLGAGMMSAASISAYQLSLTFSDGKILPRNTLGTVLPIRRVSLTDDGSTSGCAFERTPPELRSVRSKLFGIQSWVALSAADEEAAPDFAHYEAKALPVLEDEGKVVRVIAGSMLGECSPVRTSSPMFYADVTLAPAHRCHSILITMSEPSTPWLATLKLRVMCLAPRNCWSFGPATASPSGQKLTPASWRLEASQWMDPGTFGGISCLREKIASSRPRPTGGWRDSNSVPGDSEFIPLPEPEPEAVRYP